MCQQFRTEFPDGLFCKLLQKDAPISFKKIKLKTAYDVTKQATQNVIANYYYFFFRRRVQQRVLQPPRLPVRRQQGAAQQPPADTARRRRLLRPHPLPGNRPGRPRLGPRQGRRLRRPPPQEAAAARRRGRAERRRRQRDRPHRPLARTKQRRRR